MNKTTTNDGILKKVFETGILSKAGTYDSGGVGIEYKYILFDISSYRPYDNSSIIFMTNDLDNIIKELQQYIAEHPWLTTGDIVYRNNLSGKRYEAEISDDPGRKIVSWKRC